jgi:hypothetical protein
MKVATGNTFTQKYFLTKLHPLSKVFPKITKQQKYIALIINAKTSKNH